VLFNQFETGHEVLTVIKSKEFKIKTTMGNFVKKIKCHLSVKKSIFQKYCKKVLL